MNKHEAVEFLKNKKIEISNYNWSLHPEDYKLLDERSMKCWLETFDIPCANFERSFLFNLPEGWLSEVSEESDDYNEVVELYEEIYFYLQHLASAEESVENEIFRRDEKSANRNYIQSVIG
jgi:hypothetical protein